MGVLAVLAVLPSAAATAPEAGARAQATLDLSTGAKVKSYLRSLGVDPTGVVIQRGAKNYAGPNCPGPGWNCTTSTRVVQISNSSNNLNRVVCKRDRGSGSETKDSSPPDLSCDIVQPGGTRNSATCDINSIGTTGTISQSCFITQGGAQNSAVARLVAAMGTGVGEQDVVQRIEIRQTGGATSNTLDASQIALLGAAKNAGGGAVNMRQDFHQILCANQTASGAGSNTAAVSQHGAAGAHYVNTGSASIAQNDEETLSLDCTAAPGAGPFADIVNSHADLLSCAIEGGSGDPKERANSCARVQQESGSGRNKIDKQTQTNLLAASVAGGSNATIDQGSFTGGIESTQDQVSTGISSIVDAQRSEHIATVRNIAGAIDIQQTEDPRCCAAGHQIGNAGNTWALGQTLSQRAFVNGQLVDPGTFSGNVEQDGAAFGNCATTGSCGVTQSISTNTESETNTCTGSSCDVATTCEEGGEGEGCDTSQPPAPPDLDSLADCINGNASQSTTGIPPLTSILFDNQSGEHVRIFWLDYEGDLVLYNDLDNDENYTQLTYLTHPWVAVDDDGTCLAYTVSDVPSKTLVIYGLD